MSIGEGELGEGAGSRGSFEYIDRFYMMVFPSAITSEIS
jgi:hypothetical protein